MEIEILMEGSVGLGLSAVYITVVSGGRRIEDGGGSIFSQLFDVYVGNCRGRSRRYSVNIDLRLDVPLEKEANISEIDSTVVAADRATTELPTKGTMGVSSAFEGKSISVDKVRDQEKREDSSEYKEGEKSSCKGDLIEGSVVERHIKVENIKEESQVDSMRGNDNDSSKLLPQKQEVITKTDSRMQKQEKPDVPYLVVSASCAVSCSTNGAVGPSPISMAVAGWPGALSALGHFGPAAATWPGTSLPGMMHVEGNLMKGIQRTNNYIRSEGDYNVKRTEVPGKSWSTRAKRNII